MEKPEVRVIVLEGFTDDKGVVHEYGQEFSEPEGARLTDWLAKGQVRVDDRAHRKPKAKE